MLGAVRQGIETAAVTAARTRAVRKYSSDLAGRRGRSLVLLYHRVGTGGPRPEEVVPTLPLETLRRQLEVLRDMGEVVPLASVSQAPADPSVPRFAVTFDDDYHTHVRHGLPVLLRLGMPATFFVSGRRLHGLGCYWWEHLEREIESRGIADAARSLGVRASTPQRLAAACEGTPLAERFATTTPSSPNALMTVDDLREIIDAGMSIGFHTLEHPLLPPLVSTEVEYHLTHGRAALEQALGVPVTRLSYPHGRADRRIAAIARAVGYEAAFTGSGRPVSPRSNPHLLGRWEPWEMPVRDFAAQVAFRLLLPSGPQRG